MGHLPEHLQARPSKVEQRAARERNLKRAIRETNEEVDRLREALKHHEAEIAELREDKEIESVKLQHLIAAFVKATSRAPILSGEHIVTGRLCKGRCPSVDPIPRRALGRPNTSVSRC